MIDDNVGFWNWQKYVSFGKTLLRSLVAAVKEQNKQKEAHRGFSDSLPKELVEGWEVICDEWDADGFPKTKPNPYRAKELAISENQVCEELAKEEKASAQARIAPAHDATPSEFLIAGLDLENEQQRLHTMAKEQGSTPTELQRVSLIGKLSPLNTTLLSFVDDGTILAQSKQLDDNNVGLRKAYKIIYLLFVAFALVLEHDKTELFHFSRRRDAYNPSLDLGYAPHTGATPLKPKTYWRYLGFYFDRGLTFHEHVRYYATKAFTTVQAMCMLGNSTRGLSPKHYRLWYFDGARNKGAMNQLKWMQRKAALWITGAFRTSPTGGLEALAGLIPVHLMLKKLAARAVYHVATLSDTHPLRSMMGERLLKRAAPHARSAALMTPAMQGKVKSTVMEVDERIHTLTESFEPFAPEARPGDRLLDCYADCLHFDKCDPAQDRRPYLDELIAKARANPLTVLAATDGSVPQSNQYQAASAAIIYKGHCKLERTRYVSGRVTAPDVELNTILCAVRLAIKQANCQHIMVFTDSMG
ncbi:unnamed protein product [Cyclocybe aegerita]|uniref:RNase H type-1 domain-containing protein n=1 Tax=Cyclocybe aegerita TaxID=1973307 RepID=A0A8S0WP24_CYCAE|nr:unnamed protein product [Cyclocybe aegerita]